MFGLPDLVRDIVGNDDIAAIIITLATAVIIGSIGLLAPLLTIWLERKVSGRMQDRIGPNRVGPIGLLQSVADALKLLTKEIIVPRGADTVVYFLAPVIIVISVVGILAVMPLSPDLIGTDLSIGLLYIVAISSVGTIGILMAGWGSNNKYALLGAFRVIAQMISYEIPMVLAMLVPVMFAGTLSVQGVIFAQGDMWYMAMAPLAMLIFFISSTAEVGRQPFDLLEAESEIVAGFNIEYSGMPFAMIYLGEWLHAVLICFITAIVFLGGWWGPFVEEVPELGIVYMLGKALFVYLIHMWLRFTLPRLRIDQLMAFNWRFLVPLSVANLLLMGFLWKVLPEPTEAGFLAEVPRTLALFAGNLLLVAGTLFLLRDYARKEREKVEGLVDETVYAPSGTAVSASD
ncbi:MAG: NADH-quinone oxidoreductase subunit NuoH [Anaerolineales bacterium]